MTPNYFSSKKVNYKHFRYEGLYTDLIPYHIYNYPIESNCSDTTLSEKVSNSKLCFSEEGLIKMLNRKIEL